MTDLPQFESTYQNLIVASEKGGTWKTGLTTILLTIAGEKGASISAFEVDDQRRLSTMFPDITSTIVLPPPDDLVVNDQADVIRLDPLVGALASADPGTMVVADIGANNDLRVAAAMTLVDLNGQLASSERRTAVLIPFHAETDSIQAAARTARRFEVALPSATLIPCYCEETGSLEAAEHGPARKALQHLRRLEAASARLSIRKLRLSAVSAVQALDLSVGDVIRTDPARLATRLNRTVSEMHSVRTLCLRYLAEMTEEAQRVLGFPTS